MAKKEKMPKFSGFRMTKDGPGPPVYEVTMTIAPDDYNISHGATNREMVHGVFNHVNGEIGALRARAEGVAAGLDAMRARAEAAEKRAAQAQADARVLACQWRAVDDTEDLQFFGACWREAHPGRSEGDLGRDPTMADLVAALRRALGGV